MTTYYFSVHIMLLGSSSPNLRPLAFHTSAEHTNKKKPHTTSGSAQDLCGNAKFVLAADRVKFGGEGEQRVRCDRLLDRRVESAAVVNLQTGARRYERRRGVVVGGGRGVPCP